MKKLICAVGLLSVLASGCVMTSTEKGTGVGALIGGTAGAIIGHQTGRGMEGAAIGAGLGAVGGGLTGKAMENNTSTTSNSGTKRAIVVQ